MPARSVFFAYEQQNTHGNISAFPLSRIHLVTAKMLLPYYPLPKILITSVKHWSLSQNIHLHLFNARLSIDFEIIKQKDSLQHSPRSDWTRSISLFPLPFLLSSLTKHRNIPPGIGKVHVHAIHSNLAYTYTNTTEFWRQLKCPPHKVSRQDQVINDTECIQRKWAFPKRFRPCL